MAANKRTGHVIIECPQQIPCNPCIDACRTGAIRKESLNALPLYDETKCTGCKQCVAACPGQAIFYLEEDMDTAYMTFPYEYLPLPVKGQRVTAVDANGSELGMATVEQAANSKAYNLTPLVTIRMPLPEGRGARSIKRIREKSHNE
ncbi:MAG: 4Fe-4S dicluster domain-containing protein [Bacillota bacterium]